MRIFHFIFTVYLVFVSCQGWVAGRYKGCKNNKRCLSWRLKLLRKLAADKKMPLLSLKVIPTDKVFGQLYMREEAESGSNSRQHLPNIRCPNNEEEHLIPCPSADSKGNIYCISKFNLCDDRLNCPNGEDEYSELCMFYKVTQSRLTQIMHTTRTLVDRVENLENKIEAALE